MKQVRIESAAVIVFCLCVIGLAVAVLFDVRTARPPIYDPLGSAFFPKMLAYTVIGLACFIALLESRSIFKLNDYARKSINLMDYQHIFITVVSLGVYILLIDLRFVPFSLSTAAFLFVTIVSLEQWRRNSIIPALTTSIVLGLSMEIMFTRIFVMDLPRLF